MWENIKREPVRWFTGVQIIIILIVNGVLEFSSWDPSDTQVGYIIGAPLVVANAIGYFVVREAVTPNVKIPEGMQDAIERRDAGEFNTGGVAWIVVVVAIVLAVLYILDRV